MIKIDCNFDLRKNKNKTITWFWESRFIVKNVFCDFVICMFLFVFWDVTKLKPKTNAARKK